MVETPTLMDKNQKMNAEDEGTQLIVRINQNYSFAGLVVITVACGVYMRLFERSAMILSEQ